MLSKVIQKIQTKLSSPQLQEAVQAEASDATKLDIFEAFKIVAAQLKAVQFTQINQAKRDILTILSLDQKMAILVKDATRKYMISLNSSRDEQTAIQQATAVYLAQLVATYQQFFVMYQQQNAAQHLTKNKTQIADETLHLTLARYLNALFLAAKWQYFDDQAASAGTWNAVHHVIKAGENLSIMNKKVTLYDFDKEQTAIASILERGLMLDTLRRANLTRVELQLTERILRLWASNPIFSAQHRKGKNYFGIKLADDSPPARTCVPSGHAEFRFWRVTTLTNLIEDYLHAVETQKSLDDFKLASIAPAPVLIELMKKLRHEWCVDVYERQRRREARNKVAKLIRVNHGLDDICRCMLLLQQTLQHQKMRSGAEPETKPIASLPSAENWWVVDESKKGFAADLGGKISDWIVPGKLIGYSTEEHKHLFFIGEIRSVRKQSSGSYRVGVRVLTQHSLAIGVSRLSQQVDMQAATTSQTIHLQDMQFTALYMKAEAQNDTQLPTMIMPRAQYALGVRYRFMVNQTPKIIQAGRAVEVKRDWVRVELET